MIAGDASFRRYFRVWQDEMSYVVMDAPPAYENVDLFVQVATAMAQAGLNVPEIIEADLDDGYLMLSDFGDEPLQTVLSKNPKAWLPVCLQNLLLLQTQGGQHLLELPEFDSEKIRSELSLFPEWFVIELLEKTLSPTEENLWYELSQLLIDSALNQPRVWVHLDYHSRNLMKLAGRRIGIIDFQDARLGPITYDLVSLLKDCYIRYPKEIIDNYLQHYYIDLVHHDLYYQDYEQFIRAFDLMGLQRHIKVLGIFSRLSIRDGKHAYLNDLPLVYDYIIEVLDKYSELSRYKTLFVPLGRTLSKQLLRRRL